MNNNSNVNDVLQEKNQDERNKKYNEYVENITPKHNLCKDYR